MITRIDAYILSKHQKVADWAYTRWDVSPYWIAAQLFGAFCLVALLRVYFAFSADRTTTAAWDVAALIVMSPAMFMALAKDARWRAGKQVFREAFDMFFRLLWGGLLVSMVLGLIAKVFGSVPFGEAGAAYDIISCLSAVTMTTALYFYACSPPTLISRKETEMKAVLA